MRISKGCPICNSDVLGASQTGYYCRTCNLIFGRRHVVYRHARQEVRSLISRHFSGYERITSETYLEIGERPRRSIDQATRALGRHVEELTKVTPRVAAQVRALEQEEERIEWPILSAELIKEKKEQAPQQGKKTAGTKRQKKR